MATPGGAGAAAANGIDSSSSSGGGPAPPPPGTAPANTGSNRAPYIATAAWCSKLGVSQFGRIAFPALRPKVLYITVYASDK